WPYHLLTDDIEVTADMITRGSKSSFCKDAVFYAEQPVTFSQSWHQRLRWCRGYLQVLMKYGTKLIYGTLRGQFACFDLIVSMMPAYILSILSLLVNLGSALYNAFTIGFTGTAGTFLTFALNMYLTLFIVGLITAATERKQIHTTMMKRILYVFTFPLFMFTYIPIAFAALFTRCSWKPVKHMFSAKEMYTRNPC
ncbi:MAG: glycosyltransferase family 2 protein, partial [Solobacterium sp.]|nr:glycosyltransferase family 2 protein [Solobacterium sp.]